MADSQSNLRKAAEILESMQQKDLSLKLAGAQQIKFIAEQIGPERTVNEFLPFLPGLKEIDLLFDLYILFDM